MIIVLQSTLNVQKYHPPNFCLNSEHVDSMLYETALQSQLPAIVRMRHVEWGRTLSLRFVILHRLLFQLGLVLLRRLGLLDR